MKQNKMKIIMAMDVQKEIQIQIKCESKWYGNERDIRLQ